MNRLYYKSNLVLSKYNPWCTYFYDLSISILIHYCTWISMIGDGFSKTSNPRTSRTLRNSNSSKFEKKLCSDINSKAYSRIINMYRPNENTWLHKKGPPFQSQPFNIKLPKGRLWTKILKTRPQTFQYRARSRKSVKAPRIMENPRTDLGAVH